MHLPHLPLPASLDIRDQLPGKHLRSFTECEEYLLTRLFVIKGRPFREGITENSALYYGLLGVAAVALNGATDFVPEINKWLQLVDMDRAVRITHSPRFSTEADLSNPLNLSPVVPYTNVYRDGDRLRSSLDCRDRIEVLLRRQPAKVSTTVSRFLPTLLTFNLSTDL